MRKRQRAKTAEAGTLSQVSTPSRGTIKGAVWNAQGFAKNYMDWAETQGFDFLIWPESKGNGNKQEAAAEREMGPHHPIASKRQNGSPAPDPKDRGGEVCIYLSKRLAKAYMQHGSPCPRLVWVQLRVQQTPLFVLIGGYVPHRGLTYYDQEAFWADLIALKESFPANTRFLCGLDANAMLQRNIPQVTEKWCVRNYGMDHWGTMFASTLRTVGWLALSTCTRTATPRKHGGAANFVGTHLNTRGVQSHTWCGARCWQAEGSQE